MEDENAFVLAAAAVLGSIQGDNGADAVISPDISVFRVKALQLLDQRVHLLVRRIAFIDRMAGAFGEVLEKAPNQGQGIGPLTGGNPLPDAVLHLF